MIRLTRLREMTKTQKGINGQTNQENELRTGEHNLRTSQAQERGGDKSQS